MSDYFPCFYTGFNCFRTADAEVGNLVFVDGSQESNYCFVLITQNVAKAAKRSCIGVGKLCSGNMERANGFCLFQIGTGITGRFFCLILFNDLFQITDFSCLSIEPFRQISGNCLEHGGDGREQIRGFL